VYIGNLSHLVTKADILGLVENMGGVVNIILRSHSYEDGMAMFEATMDRTANVVQTGTIKTYAFVEFERGDTPDQAVRELVSTRRFPSCG
jgi:RNA recognition motif-containing protein